MFENLKWGGLVNFLGLCKMRLIVVFGSYSSLYIQVITRCRAIAGSTARCGCNFRYISNFSAALGGFHCDNNAFELNNSINHGKIRVFNIIYLLPLNSLFNSQLYDTVQNAEIVHSTTLCKPTTTRPSTLQVVGES